MIRRRPDPTAVIRNDPSKNVGRFCKKLQTEVVQVIALSHIYKLCIPDEVSTEGVPNPTLRIVTG